MLVDQPERFVFCSELLILECKNCGERKLLLGLEEDWLSEGVDFECRCGKRLTLANRAPGRSTDAFFNSGFDPYRP